MSTRGLETRSDHAACCGRYAGIIDCARRIAAEEGVGTFFTVRAMILNLETLTHRAVH
jgi:hypothetical protein